MKNIKLDLRQQFIRIGSVAFLLVGALTINAQEVNSAAGQDVTAKAKQQSATKEVQGAVYDAATNKPLAGARVRALGNRQFSALTKEDGTYTLKVPEYVNTITVQLQDYNGTQVSVKGNKAKDAFLYKGLVNDYYSNATSLVNNQKIEITNSSALTIDSDIENRLNAKMRTISRGGMPAQGVMMLVNGLNSLNTNVMPLVVVDGVIWDMQYERTGLHQGFFNNVLSTIDPEDIASVEVLKNGTALYGAKGANGVLLIETKRGKSIVTKINIRAYGGFETRPSRVKMMNAGQFRNYVTEFLGTSEYGERLSKATSVPFLNEDPNYLYYNMYHNNTDWQKDLYHTAFTQNYKVSVEGGDDVAMYNLSLGYSKSDATAKHNDFDRLNIRFNTDVNLFKNFTTGLDFAYTRSAYNILDNGWAADYSNSNVSSPNVLGLLQSPFVSPYMSFIRYDQALGQLVPDASTSVYSGKNFDEANNPLAFAKSYGYAGLANPYWILQNGNGDNKNYQEQTQFSVAVAPRYQINKNLVISDRFSYILNRTNEKYYLPTNGVPETEVEGLGGIQSVVRSQFAKETTLFNDLRLQWKKMYGVHALDIFGGVRISSYTFTDSHLAGYNNDNDKMPNMAYNLDYIDYGGIEDKATNIAWYVNGNYNYKNKYFLNLTATMESSSRFGDKADGGLELAGVRWGIFPSIQAGWVISNEDWFNVNAINHLKLYAGFDVSGNDNVDYYSSRTYFANVKYMEKATGLYLANIANPKIKWETTKRFNIGLQTSMLQNRLNVGVNYYYSKTTDLLTRKAVSDVTGLQYMWANDGAIKNHGVDVTVDAVIYHHGDWSWKAGASLGHYHNEVDKLVKTSFNNITTYALDENGAHIDGSAKTMVGYTSDIYGKNNILTAEGHAVGVFYGYASKGVFATDAEAASAGRYGYLRYPTGLTEQPYRNFKAGDVHFVDQNGDGWISEADMVVIGDPNPDIFGNFYTTLNWKRLQLDVNFKYSLGNDIYNFQRAQIEGETNTWNQTTAVVNRWRYEGQVTDVPRTMCATNDEWVNNERFSDRWIEDGSYLKLKKVRLTYTLPLRLSWLQGVAVWGEANNVFTISKYLGSDPEVSIYNGVLYQGIDAGLLPSNRNFNLGLTINL